MGPPTDEELLRRISAGDTEAFESLYDRYARAAYSLAVRILGDGRSAEDVVQDAFLRVWRMAGTFDAQRGAGRSWLLGMVHHRSIDVYRRSRGRPANNIELRDDLATDGDDLWHAVVLAVDGEALHAALTQLPAEQRAVIDLAYFSGFSHREIAEELGLPLGTVKSRTRLAMARLRESLKSREAGL
jgi:RNA polymerase sigma-70 factor, ECF subfamily